MYLHVINKYNNCWKHFVSQMFMEHMEMVKNIAELYISMINNNPKRNQIVYLLLNVEFYYSYQCFV